MKRSVALVSIVVLLVGTVMLHETMAFFDQCTGVEVCKVTSPSQFTTTLTCNQCASNPQHACIDLTVNLVAPIHTATDCQDLANVLQANPLAFVRIPPIPNIGNCCIWNQTVTLFIIPDFTCP